MLPIHPYPIQFTQPAVAVVNNSNESIWSIVAATIATIIVSYNASIASFFIRKPTDNPGQLVKHHNIVQLKAPDSPAAAAPPPQPAAPPQPREFDFRESMELNRNIGSLWKGRATPAAAPYREGYMQALQNETGQPFTALFDVSRHEPLSKEFEGDLNEDLYKRDLSRIAKCENGEHFYGLGKEDPNDLERLTKLFDGLYPGKIKMKNRAINLSSQKIPILMNKMLEGRYANYAGKDPGFKFQDYERNNSDAMQYCNFCKDENGHQIIEYTMTKEIVEVNAEGYKVKTGYYIPMTCRVNIATGDATLTWNVIKSENPDNDPRLDPYNLLTRPAEKPVEPGPEQAQKK